MHTVTRRTRNLIVAAIWALPAHSALAADHVWQSWYGINGTWSNANAWDASGDIFNNGPYESTFPNNTPTLTHDAVLGAGTATLDGDYTINHLGLYQYAGINGNGNLTTLTGFNWYGGSVGGTGTLTVSANTTLNMGQVGDTAYSRTLSRTLDNYGTANYTAGHFHINLGGTFNNYGTFNAATGNDLLRSQGTGTFVNFGTFNKTVDSEFRVTPNFVNNGVVNVPVGTLRLESEFTNQNAGVINVSPGATLKLEGTTTATTGSLIAGAGTVTIGFGTHTFAAGTFQPTGVVNLSGGTVHFNSAFSPSSIGTLGAVAYFHADQTFADVELTGNIRGEGTVTVTNSFTWTKGLMQDPGQTVFGPNAYAVIAPSQGNSPTLYDRTITNHGTTEHANGILYMNTNAVFNNFGSFLAASDTGISRSAGTSTFYNSGTFNKTNPGTYDVNSRFFNTGGTVNVKNGTLILDWTSSNSGTFNVSAGALLQLGDTMTHAAGSTITGAGNLWIAAGTHDFSAATLSTTGTFHVGGNSNVTIANTIHPTGVVLLGVNNSSPNVTFNADQSFADLDLSATLNGTGNITVTNSFAWGGPMAGTGKLTIAPTATATYKDTGKVLTRPVDNFGTFDYAVGTLYINGGGSINNFGTINASSPGGFPRSSGTGAVNNHDNALFNKTGTTTFPIANPFTNAVNGTVNVNEGTLNLNSGGTNFGTINIAAGATLGLSSSYTFAPGSMIAGAGNVTFASGTHVVPADTFNPTGVLTVASNSTVTLQGQINPSALATVAGTLVLNTDNAFPNVHLTGTLSGAGNVTIASSFTFNGTLSGTGVTTVQSGGTLVMDSSNHTLNRQLDNHGAASHTAGTLSINNGTFNNFGTFTTTATNITRSSGTSAFNNPGTFTKDGTSTLSMNVALSNTGTLSVNAGALELSGTPSTSSGTINVAAGASLKLLTGFSYGPTSSLTGAGSVWLASGTHNFPANTYFVTGPLTVDGTSTIVTFNNPINPSSLAPVNGTLNFNADQTLPSLTLLTSSNLGGTGNLTLTNSFNWTGGNLTAGGKTTLGPAATVDLSASNNRSLSRTLELLGTTHYAGGTLGINNGLLVNKGIFNASATSGISRTSGTAAFNNEGTFNKTGTTSFSVTNSVAFNNAPSGIVNVNEGTLDLNGTGSNDGTINLSPAGTLKLSSTLTHAPASRIQGAGAVEFTGGTNVFPAGTYNATGPLRLLTSAQVTFNSPISPSSIDPITAALVNFNADQTFPTLSINTSTTLGGSGNLTITSNFAFIGGTLAGPGLMTIPTGATFDLSSNFSRTLSRNLDLFGTANLTDGSLSFAGTTSYTINNHGTLNIAKSGIGRSTGTHTVLNAGTLNWTAADGSLVNGVILSNTGTLNVTAGKMTLGSSPAQHTGTTLAGGTWNVSDGASLIIAAGSNIATNEALVTLSGPTSKFDKLNALTTNNHTLNLLAGRSFTTAGAFTNNATALLNIGASSSFTSTGHLTSTGPITLGAGSTLHIKGGTTQQANVLTVNGGTLIHSAGTSQVNALQKWSDGSTLSVTGGHLTLASDAGSFYPTPTLAATVAGTTAKLQTSSTQRLKSLTIGDGGTFIQQPGGWSTLLTRSLDITGTGRLDMTDDKLIVDYDAAGTSAIDTVRQFVLDGRIMSSIAAADPQNRKTVAFVESSTLGVNTWGNLQVDSSAVLAAVTWYGDANLDGRINADDFALLDRGYLLNRTGWTNGDFNHSGTVDAADYLLIDRVFAQQTGTLSPSLLAARQQQFGPTYVSELIIAIPEPSLALSSILYPLSSLFLRTRCRRNGK